MTPPERGAGHMTDTGRLPCPSKGITVSALHESVPVFKKNAGIAALLLVLEIVVSYGAVPVLSGEIAIGVKLAISLGIAVLWTVFSLYFCKALEAGYMSVMELSAHPPVVPAQSASKPAKAA